MISHSGFFFSHPAYFDRKRAYRVPYSAGLAVRFFYMEAFISGINDDDDNDDDDRGNAAVASLPCISKVAPGKAQ